MNWAKLIFSVVSEAWEAWRSSRKPEEPVASQRDIAIGVASGEAARREGKIASTRAKVRKPRVGDTVRAVGHDASAYQEPGKVDFVEDVLCHVKFPQPLLRGWFRHDEVEVIDGAEDTWPGK